MIQLVCHKKQSINLKRKMAPIEPTNQSPEPPGHMKMLTGHSQLCRAPYYTDQTISGNPGMEDRMPLLSGA